MVTVMKSELNCIVFSICKVRFCITIVHSLYFSYIVPGRVNSEIDCVVVVGEVN